MATKKTTKQRGLGRGLSALMADVNDQNEGTAEEVASAKRPDLIVPIETVFANPDQPRRSFDQAALEELAASIKEKGIIQPLIVRPRPNHDGEYEIVAGERRWRAAQMARLHEIPVLLREFDDTEVLEIAIIENIQRADLNPIDEATGYAQLMNRFGHTQEKLAEVLGKSRSYIANITRLLTLPEDVQTWLAEGKLSAGHARALITSTDPVALAKQVISKGLSVRETEKLAKGDADTGGEGKKTSAKRPAKEKDADTKALEADLSATLGMKVSIEHTPEQESGKISIAYDDLNQLDAICALLNG